MFNIIVFITLVTFFMLHKGVFRYDMKIQLPLLLIRSLILMWAFFDGSFLRGHGGQNLGMGDLATATLIRRLLKID